MKKANREALDAYYREAGSWADDRHDAIRRSRTIAWGIAGAAILVALAEAFALTALAPLKTVVPYTLLVDKQTGYIQALQPLEPGRVAPDAALTQSFLVQYVIARESFDIDSIQADYRKLALWSADKARADYMASVQVSSPESPLVRYPRSTTVETRIKSVSPLGDRAALVRFETQRRDAGGQAAPPRPYVAVVRYRFSDQPMSTEDRFTNPLGFQVVQYRRDAEALPLPEPVSSPVATVAVPVAPPNARPQAAPSPAQDAR